MSLFPPVFRKWTPSFPKVEHSELKFTQNTKNKLNTLCMSEKIEKKCLYKGFNFTLKYARGTYFYVLVWAQKKIPYPQSIKLCRQLYILYVRIDTIVKAEEVMLDLHEN